MRLKSYFAGTVEAAISLAGKELGPDALLVYSRPAPPEARYLGAYEVVFSEPQAEADPEACETTATVEPDAGSRVARPAPVADETLSQLSREVSSLRGQMERMERALIRTSSAAPPDAGLTRTTADFLTALLNSEVSTDLVARLGERLRGAPLLDLRGELESLFQVDARLGEREGGKKVIALVGPPGSGKTTTLVKLAAVYGLTSRRSAQLLSMDMYRIGGAEQLRSYAAILGMGFQALETPGALAQSLQEHRNKDLILIDTPGHSEKDMDAAAEVYRFLASHPEVDTHLTLSASMKSADLKRAVDRYETFRPAKLLFTRLDETGTFGPVLSEAVRTGKPISFFTNGQQVPEDFERATRSRLVDLVLGEASREPEAPSRDSEPRPAAGPAREQTAGCAAAAA